MRFLVCSDDCPLSRWPATYREEHGDNSRLGMALAYLSGDSSMKAIADEFGVHYATVSRAVKEYDSKNIL